MDWGRQGLAPGAVGATGVESKGSSFELLRAQLIIWDIAGAQGREDMNSVPPKETGPSWETKVADEETEPAWATL